MPDSKVKKDGLGLYINDGGCIYRPFYGTCFLEGCVVKVHHFRGHGGIDVGVGTLKASFRKEHTYEYWSITGVGEWAKNNPDSWFMEKSNCRMSYKRWDDFVKASTRWYWDSSRLRAQAKVKHNEQYARSRAKRYSSKAYYGSGKAHGAR